MTTHHPFRRFHRTTISALVTVLVGAATFVAPNVATAQEDFVNGTGSAFSRIARVGPSASNLSFAQTVGLPLADFVDTVARGESRVFGYAALEDTVKKDVPEATDGHVKVHEEFPPLRVESTEDGSARGEEQEPKPGILQRARANDKPSGHASVSIESIEIPGLLEASGGVARSFAGVFERETDEGTELVREAGGSVDIGRVSIAGGLVVLRDLHWELTQRTDSNDDESVEISSTFVVGSAIIDGERYDGPVKGAELRQLFGPINEALAPTGVELVAPQEKLQSGIASLDPLGIRVVDSPIGQQVVAPALEAAQPVREPLFNGIIENCGDCANVVLVGDITLGVAAGSGKLLAELGGITGTTGGQAFEGFFSGGFDFGGGSGAEGSPTAARGGPATRDTTSPSATAPGASGISSGGPGGTGDTGTDAGTAPSGTESPQPSGRDVAATQQAQPAASGEDNGIWAVGLVGLLGTLAFAAADYRKLRARRREIPAG